jgi:hypothetical protein
MLAASRTMTKELWTGILGPASMSFSSNKRLSIVLSVGMTALYVGCVDLTPPWNNESVTPVGPGNTDGSINSGTGGIGSTGSGPGGYMEGYAGVSGTLDGGDAFARTSDAALSSEAGSVSEPPSPGVTLDSGNAFDGPLGTGGAAESIDARAGSGGVGGGSGASGAARGGSPGGNPDGATSAYDGSVDRAMSTGGKSKGNGGATGAGGVVASGGGPSGSGGVVGSGGVGTGGAASSGGVGTGGAVSTGGLTGTGGVVGSGGAVATGGSSTVGTGGTWSYDCSRPLVPPSGASLLVTDFSDWNATTETWGRAGGIIGRIFAYPLTTSTMTAAVEGSPAGLHLGGSLGSAGYGGGGIGINACASIAAFKQIEFTYYGSAAHCNLTWMVQTFDQRPTDQDPPGGCDRTDASSTICFVFPQVGVGAVVATPSTSPVTLTRTLATFSGWSDARAAQIIGLQWQFTNDGTTDDAGVGCVPDLTITSVRLLP